ncbi:MAG: ATP-binding protein [Candidatus Methanomethyliaceae archaeon]
MNGYPEAVGVVLSQSTTREATCQLLEEAEQGGIREGMLLVIETSAHKRRLLARVSEIVPYNAFYTEGDPWSEARRKNLPLPEHVARRYEVCKLELLVELPGTNEITIPPHPGDRVLRIDPKTAREEIFGVREAERGVIWFGTQAGYEGSPVPLDIEAIPMHMAVFGVTGSGKSFDMGALTERLVSIPVAPNRAVSFPMLIIDAHGDYLEYARYRAEGGDLGAVDSVVRYVFPDAWRRLRTADRDWSRRLEPIGINLDNLGARDLAELIVQFYGGVGSELQIHGLERTFTEMLDAGWTLSSLLTSGYEQLEAQVKKKSASEIHDAAKGAILRALAKFRETEDRYQLFSHRSPLQDGGWVDDLTRRGNIAIVDFSAEGAPGVELPVKQLVMTYLATVLFASFTQYKVRGEDRYLLFVIEEAQNFCPAPSYPVGAALAKTKLSAIATQGRKFGLGLCLISQRPSFVDGIVLSMCNSFFIHRISPEDVSFVRTITGGLPPGLLSRLTKLGRGELIVTGQLSKVPFPLVVKVEAEDRKVPHPVGTTEVVKNLARLRGVQ